MNWNFFMCNKYTPALLMLLIFISLLLSSCGTSPTNGASQAIEGYYESLIAKDLNRLINYSCADWEANAHQEIRTFDAVEVNLENFSCQESGKDGEIILVSCTGKIVANYGNEILEINLAERSYRSKYEGGEWRMCGYQ